jgi:septum formation protein
VPLETASPQIILASASPRRLELLEQIAVRVIVQAVDIDESQKPGEPVMDYVQRLAMEKAQRGFETIENLQKLPVLGADTVVVVNSVILGKPENRRHAKAMLEKLSGQKHTVHTSVAIVTENKMLVDTSSSQVSFKELDEQEIDYYLATGEADDKAGSYAIQGIAAQFIKNINGSFSGVMGLPLYETAQLLKQCGVLPSDHYKKSLGNK